MTQQHINLGTAPAGTDGDTVRNAMSKSEANFNELYGAICPMGGFKNKIINGNFDFWQRGTSFSAAGYTADRWSMQFNAVTSPSALQGVFSAGDLSGGIGSRNYLSIGCSGNTDATNHYMNMVQRIEGVQTFAGRTCTVSFRIFTSAARAISIGFSQAFGTGGSAAVSAIGAQKINLVSGWQTVTATINIPNISGKTIGTSNDYLVFIIWLTAGTAYDSQTGALGAQNGSVLISGIQIEDGNVATMLEQRPLAAELALCQRYYEKSFDVNTPVAADVNSLSHSGFAFSSNSVRHTQLFKISKRASPTMGFYRPNSSGSAAGATTNQWAIFVSSWTATTVSVLVINTSGFTTQLSGTITGGTSCLIEGNWTADAEL